MDPVSGAASVIALVQLAGQIVSLCQTYYLSVRDARKDIKRLQTELMVLNDALVALADEADRSRSDRQLLAQVLDPQGDFMKSCTDDLEHLLAQLEQNVGRGDMSKFGIRALKWPLSSKQVDKFLLTLERRKSSISLVVHSEALHGIQKLSVQNEQIAAGIESMKKHALARDLRQWLAASNASANFEAAYDQHQPGTGEWLLRSDVFSRYEQVKGTSLWLVGPPGTGKTVYSSIVLSHLIEPKSRKPGVGLAYFFFDFKDEVNKTCDMCLRTLLEQLSQQCESTPNALMEYYTNCLSMNTKPGVDGLLATLRTVISGFSRVDVVIDALDESSDLQTLLKVIRDVLLWDEPSFHLFITSRPLRIIEESLVPTIINRVDIEPHTSNFDIGLMIRERLHTDSRLLLWEKAIKDEIESAIMQRVNGMFRWAVCQLDAVTTCFNVASLRKTLAELPHTVEETYDRILSSLARFDQADVRWILEWLAFSRRILSLQELNSAFSVLPETLSRVDDARLLPRPYDFLTLCPSLATIGSVREGNWRVSSERDAPIIKSTIDSEPAMVKIIQLSHSSVKDYLLSPRLLQGPFKSFALSDPDTNLRLATACLTYLNGALEAGPCETLEETRNRLECYPLLEYAAHSWASHAREVQQWDDGFWNQVVKLMDPKRTPAFFGWVQLLRFFKYGVIRVDDVQLTPLYFAASFGLPLLVKRLLAMGARVNEPGGFFGGTPLHAAVWREFHDVAKVLVDGGANSKIKDSNNITPSQLGKYVRLLSKPV